MERPKDAGAQPAVGHKWHDEDDDVIRPDIALSVAEFEAAVTVPNSYA